MILNAYEGLSEISMHEYVVQCLHCDKCFKFFSTNKWGMYFMLLVDTDLTWSIWILFSTLQNIFCPIEIFLKTHVLWKWFSAAWFNQMSKFEILFYFVIFHFYLNMSTFFAEFLFCISINWWLLYICISIFSYFWDKSLFIFIIRCFNLS